MQLTTHGVEYQSTGEHRVPAHGEYFVDWGFPDKVLQQGTGSARAYAGNNSGERIIMAPVEVKQYVTYFTNEPGTFALAHIPCFGFDVTDRMEALPLEAPINHNGRSFEPTGEFRKPKSGEWHSSIAHGGGPVVEFNESKAWHSEQGDNRYILQEITSKEWTLVISQSEYDNLPSGKCMYTTTEWSEV